MDYENTKPVLQVRNFSGYGFSDISFDLYPGEILGVAGVVGAGRTEMISTIFGRDKTLAGTVTWTARTSPGLSTKKILQEGINFVPEDRHYHGLFKIRSISSNTTSALLGSREMGKVDMNRRHQREISQQYADQVPHQDRLSGRPHRQPVGRQPAKGGHLPRPVHPSQGRHPRRTHPRHRRRRPQRRVRASSASSRRKAWLC